MVKDFIHEQDETDYFILFHPFADICLHLVKFKNIQFFSIQIQLV